MKKPARGDAPRSITIVELLAVVALAAAMGIASEVCRSRTSRDDHSPTSESEREIVLLTPDSDPQVDTSTPTRVEVLQPINQSVLVQRSLDIFPAGYLATISIIQGVALSALVVQAVPILAGSGTGLSKMATLSESLFVFVAIVVVSYEYLWFTTIMRWVPTFRDTLVPLVLGVGEIVPAMLLDERQRQLWWIVVTVFIALGAAAYKNTISRLRADLFDGKDAEQQYDVWKLIRDLLRRLIICCCVGVAICIATTVLISAWPDQGSLLTIVGAAALILPIAVGMAVLSERVLNEVYDEYQIQRKPSGVAKTAVPVRPA